MYLSRLILNPRCRRVRRELQEPYELHRTVMSAFPDGDEGSGRVLYRVDTFRRRPEPVLLVQSGKEPNWEEQRAEWPDDFLAEARLGENPLDSKRWEPAFSSGQMLHFRLRANATVKRDGRRLGLLSEGEQMAWLARKAKAGGFRPLSAIMVPEGFVQARKRQPPEARPLTWYAVRFEGTLQVIDPAEFLIALSRGVGSAKGFGFGLLSVAPTSAL
jgi:CRISPR system Cascade subunit CasE